MLVIGLSMHDDSTHRRQMAKAGARAYLRKDGACENLVDAIRRLVPQNSDKPSTHFRLGLLPQGGESLTS